MTRFEFPPGSGRAADYSPAEVDFLRPFWEEGLRHPRLGPVRAERERELRLLHELKAEFGCTLERPSPWTTGAYGWDYAPVAPGVVEAARARCRVLDAELKDKGVMGADNFDSGKQWSSLVTEPLVAAWFEEQGATDVTLNGGFDSLPDIDLAGARVSVKSPVRKAFAPSYNAEVAAQRQRHDADSDDEYLFAPIQAPGDGTHTVVLIGGIPARDFWRGATVLRKGDHFWNGSPVVNPVAQLRFDKLEPAREWFARVTR